ncbi:hypothetical protein RRG08_064211 [Elysia crispata]|uniref:40S ribosomal protein S12 n=1 Tax=Elysia crispata TaxID=231223 RepID=A0AAE1CX46_9GAST|nr:hypothetical protein RRG08_064211 [Elysia crispata]
MSDAEVEAPAAAAAPGEPMDIYQALQEVLKTSLIHDGLSRGAKEATKSLDKREAHLCVLANSVDEPLYCKLIEALCNEHGINLLKVDDAKKLGEWAGLCKLDKEGKARKVNACGCVVVKDYGMETPALDVVRNHFKQKLQCKVCGSKERAKSGENDEKDTDFEDEDDQYNYIDYGDDNDDDGDNDDDVVACRKQGYLRRSSVAALIIEAPTCAPGGTCRQTRENELWDRNAVARPVVVQPPRGGALPVQSHQLLDGSAPMLKVPQTRLSSQDSVEDPEAETSLRPSWPSQCSI